MEGRAPASPGDRGTFVASPSSASNANHPPINPVTKPSQIILDKGLVLDKEAEVNAPLPLHRKNVTVRY
jgi:hypothetical protein